MSINPNAIVLVIFVSLVGYLVGDSHGAIVGATIGFAWVLLASLFT